jgi:hypothetical protein
MAPFAGLVKHQLSALLMRLRDEIDTLGLELDRLPGWIQGSDIRAGWIGESVIAVFEEAAQVEDRFRIRGTVRSDVVILLDTPDFTPVGAYLEATESPGAIILSGPDAQGDLSAGPIMVLGAERPAFFDCGNAGYHGPRFLWNLIFSLEHALDSGPVERRFLPCAIYLHEADLRSIGRAWERIRVHLLPNWHRSTDRLPVTTTPSGMHVREQCSELPDLLHYQRIPA